MALAAAVAQNAPVAPAPVGGEPVVVLRGEHFELVAHGLARPVAEQALTVCEATIPRVEAGHGRVVVERRGAVVTGERLHVELCADAAALEHARAAASSRQLPDPRAFTDPETKTAWIAVWPGVTREYLEALGLPRPALVALARESARVGILRARGSLAPLPYVYLEGTCARIAREVCDRIVPLPERLEDPQASTLCLGAQRLIATGGIPDLFAFLEGTPFGLTNDERRALAVELFEFLDNGEHEAVLDALTSAARLTQQSDTQAALGAAFRAAVGDAAARAAFQSAFESRLAALVPPWEELHPSLWVVKGTYLQSAGATNAVCWRRLAPCAGSYECRGQVAFMPGEHRQANLLLGPSETGFVQVSFVADHGVDVLRFDAHGTPDGTWSTLASAPLGGLVEGEFVPFRIVVGTRALEVWIAGKPALTLQEPGLPLPCAFGLGAYAGTTCAWKDLVFKDLP